MIHITSEERREGRYQRRKAKREAKKQAFMIEYDKYEDVFTYKLLYVTCRHCIMHYFGTSKEVDESDCH